MSNIPEKFELLGQEWTVEILEDSTNGENLGRCHEGKSNIQLQKIHMGGDVPDSSIEGTFYHELIHAMLFMGGYHKLSADEKLVSFLGGMIHQYINQQQDVD